MFDPIVLCGGSEASAPILDVLSGAIEAVDPQRAVRSALGTAGRNLLVDGTEIPLPQGPIIVLALGKAAVGMARGAAEALEGREVRGVVATPDPGPVPPGMVVAEGSHPIPDSHSLAAGDRLMTAAGGAGAGDLVLVLVSGGGSACAEALHPGISLDRWADLSEGLLASGAPIEEINIVRRSLSALKGGGLAATAAPATVVTLALSDVVGNDLPTIAGGPTVADPTGPAEALAVIERRGLLQVAGRDIADRLRAGFTSPAPPRGGTVVVIGDGAAAAEGARSAAERLGIAARVVATDLVGEAVEVGARLAGVAMGPGPMMSIFAGETTVTVTGAGRGGRNQEAALAAAMAIDGDERAVVASLGTDGIDGPTSAAGGIVDGGTAARGRALGLNAGAALEANDSHPYLAAVGGTLVTGPTGTNVGDVMVAWRR